MYAYKDSYIGPPKKDQYAYKPCIDLVDHPKIV